MKKYVVTLTDRRNATAAHSASSQAGLRVSPFGSLQCFSCLRTVGRQALGVRHRNENLGDWAVFLELIANQYCNIDKITLVIDNTGDGQPEHP
jgi:hypothetical protein